MATAKELLAKNVTASQMSSFFIDKMGIVSANSYGAVGDGVTDDSTALQSAVDAASTNGITSVWLPVGTYLCSTALTGTSEITFISNSSNTAITGTTYPVYPWGETVTAVNTHSTQASSDGVHHLATTANTDYYVNVGTGDDTNTGLAAGTAFKALQYAIDQLPQTTNHHITINVAAGDYTGETQILIRGFSGKGYITISGTGAVKLPDVFIVGNSCSVFFENVSSASLATLAYYVGENPGYVKLDTCTMTENDGMEGVYTLNSGVVEINACEISYKANAVLAYNSLIYLEGVSGSNNTNGYYNVNSNITLLNCTLTATTLYPSGYGSVNKNGYWLNNNTLLESTNTPDGYFWGDFVNGKVDEDGTEGEYLYMGTSGYRKALATASTTLPAVAIRVTTGTGTQTVMIRGFSGGYAGLTKGQRVWISPDTAGGITPAMPTSNGGFQQCVGIVEEEDIIRFEPSMTYNLITT